MRFISCDPNVDLEIPQCLPALLIEHIDTIESRNGDEMRIHGCGGDIVNRRVSVYAKLSKGLMFWSLAEA